MVYNKGVKITHARDVYLIHILKEKKNMTNLQQLTTIEELTNIDQLINEYCANITKCDLTPSTWGYNATRIINALTDIVEQNGGIVSYKYHDYKLIGNRLHYDSILDTQKRLINLKENQWTIDKPDRALKFANKQLDNLKEGVNSFNNSAINMREGHYIAFKLNDYIYSFSFDDNPFFEHYYSKNQIIENNTYDNNYYLNKLKDACPAWAFNGNVLEEDIKAWAQLLFDKLIESNSSAKVYDRKRVPNYYNDGYHYEQIHKSNMIKINF